MVKTSELPGEDKHPNKSTIIINDDKVKLYLFADGFNGINALVGNMELSNIFIDDRRENYHLPKPMGIPDNQTMIHYRNFFKGMIDEYNRHYPKHGDSYICCDINILYNLLIQSENKSKLTVMYNPSHLFDIANYCMFLYTQIMGNKK